MKEIELTQGKFAIVDDEDFERLNKFNYYTRVTGRCLYALRSITKSTKKYGKVFMHHDVLQCSSSQMVDHINHDGLDNRKENLRFTDKAKNAMNGSSELNSTSKYRGVCIHRGARWSAQINTKGKKKHLGIFVNEEDAAKAYDTAAKELFGEFANLNFR